MDGKQKNLSLIDGLYTLSTRSTSFQTYCDMTPSGQAWTLIARFSNSDAKNWMEDSGEWWYDKRVGVGDISTTSVNADMLSPAFWLVRAANSRSRAVITLNTPHCCRPQVTVWVERHSERKSPAMVTSEMVEFGQVMTAREIAMFNMAVSFKQRMDSDKLHVMDRFKRQHKSASGATGDMVMERCC
ncbi:uncharacterized protein LOC122951629 [Acropora millepora]|uniref:uncharacterized protein LOC122951629 n=1 Tax=Acropora millepora TaxID=45264 RepID=UPI001CF2DD32|nr:uncharacterized protein LOC122951629 [Acropora millepora]